MYCLLVIHSLNNRPPRKDANAHLLREPSYCATRAGVVLHSASLRSTAFIDRKKHPRIVGNFIGAFKRCKSLKARNRLVDSFF
jgi:hypothetical protein